MNTTTTDIVLSAAAVEITAAQAPKQPSIKIVAYTGGVMRVPGWGPLAIDIAALDCGEELPLLVDHDPGLDNVLGKGKAQVREGRLLVAGNVAGSTAAAKKVLDLARDGFPLQASVGVAPEETASVAPGEKVQVNGKTLTAPRGGLTLVTKGKLREVSVVTLGCDDQTAVSIAASQKGVNDGNGHDAGDEVLVAERMRVAAIVKVCGGKYQDIQAQAIGEGWDTMRTELEVLRASRPKFPGIASGMMPATPEVIEAALALRMGMHRLAEKHLRPEALEMAQRLGVTHALDICKAALQADRQDIPSGREALVKAALSTYSLPTALGDLASKSLLDAYRDAPASWRAFAAIRSVPDFKTHTAIRPSFAGGLEQVAPGGELKHGTVGEWTASFRIDTYGKLLSIDRRDLINDDLSVFADASAAMGRAALRKLNDLVFQVLLGNAGGFFSAANGNLLEGAGSGLGIDALSSAIKAMLSQRDDEGNDLDIRPATLLVPPALEPQARALISSELIAAAVGLPTGNSLRNVVNLQVEPRLANAAKYGAAASDAHWYLFGPPAATPMVVAFLNGREEPTVEFFGLEQEIDRLGVSWRVYFDFGSALVDPRAAVRSKGQA